MRLFLAGFFLLLMPAFAFAQAKGEVESIGFNNTYRPDAWTPMVVRLRPETNEPGTFQLQVWQHDVDGDRPRYVRTITLNGMEQAREQRYWMYFLPQPIDKGLPDQNNGGTLKDLQRDVQVFLCTADGKRQITQLPITSALNNVDPFRDYSQLPRGAKLILAVSDGSSQMAWRDYDSAVGMMEDVVVVNLQPRDLPEDPIGYEGVDGIVWLNSDPSDLDKAGEHKLAAIQEYIRYGGRLVVSQPTTDWQKILGFAHLLPVTVQGVSDKDNLEPLRSMARPREADIFRRRVDPWERPIGPFQFARATAKPGAVVETWIDWKGDGLYTDATPYLVRGALGLGEVTWVAQDLGNPAIAGKTATGGGWPYVWDKVFGWKNDTYIPPSGVSKDDQDLKPRLDLYRPGGPVDLGFPLSQGLDNASKSAWLIFVAVAFFLVYWVVAGPGSYLYLAAKERSGFSWFAFGLSALAATVVTVLVVKVVLRGAPEIMHVSFVRIAPNQPALVYTRFGLYIPRDGEQSIELNNIATDHVSYISGYAQHPQQLGDVSEFPAPSDYLVPVRDIATPNAPVITVPYRSSSKKFQARWIGELPEKFTGNVRLERNEGSDTFSLSGTITNQTGKDFDDVYLAYHGGRGRDDDRVIYLPKWSKNTTLDLKKDLARPLFIGTTGGLSAVPGQGKVISDDLGNADVKTGTARDSRWIGFWYSRFKRNTYGDPNIEDKNFTFVLPMLSLFDRLPPMWNKPENPGTGSGGSVDRIELFRRGGRMLNLSHSLMSGQLAIMTAARGPVPVPMEVAGDKAEGKGWTLYQFLLPIDRGDIDKPTTQPVAIQ